MWRDVARMRSTDDARRSPAVGTPLEARHPARAGVIAPAPPRGDAKWSNEAYRQFTGWPCASTRRCRVSVYTVPMRVLGALLARGTAATAAQGGERQLVVIAPCQRVSVLWWINSEGNRPLVFDG